MKVETLFLDTSQMWKKLMVVFRTRRTEGDEITEQWDTFYSYNNMSRLASLGRTGWLLTILPAGYYFPMWPFPGEWWYRLADICSRCFGGKYIIGPNLGLFEDGTQCIEGMYMIMRSNIHNVLCGLDADYNNFHCQWIIITLKCIQYNIRLMIVLYLRFRRRWKHIWLLGVYKTIYVNDVTDNRVYYFNNWFPLTSRIADFKCYC